MATIKYYMIGGYPVLAILKNEREGDLVAVAYDSKELVFRRFNLKYSALMPVQHVSSWFKEKMVEGLARLYPPHDLYHELKQRNLVS